MSAVAAELPGARVLDLFAGSGALGLEALSRRAGHVTFVEHAPAALRILRANIAALGAGQERVAVVRSDAVRFVEALPALGFDVAFADPPYGRGHAQRLAALFAICPFARLLCIEHGRDEPLESPCRTRERRYGDTLLTFLAAGDER
jgi:16S rRNA (guanine966-N2)-methyltransferase